MADVAVRALRLVPDLVDEGRVDDGEDARVVLREGLLYLRGMADRLERARGGAFYAVIVRAWIRSLEQTLRRLR